MDRLAFRRSVDQAIRRSKNGNGHSATYGGASHTASPVQCDTWIGGNVSLNLVSQTWIPCRFFVE